MAILKPKSPILEAKRAQVILYLDFEGSPAERARPIAKLEPGDFSLELRTIPHASARLRRMQRIVLAPRIPGRQQIHEIG